MIDHRSDCDRSAGATRGRQQAVRRAAAVILGFLASAPTALGALDSSPVIRASVRPRDVPGAKANASELRGPYFTLSAFLMKFTDQAEARRRERPAFRAAGFRSGAVSLVTVSSNSEWLSATVLVRSTHSAAGLLDFFHDFYVGYGYAVVVDASSPHAFRIVHAGVKRPRDMAVYAQQGNLVVFIEHQDSRRVSPSAVDGMLKRLFARAN